MIVILQLAAAFAAAVTMTQALAHALEYPGKMRLERDQYFTVQTIYYPGFTFGGAAEPLTIVFLALLLVLQPTGSAIFWIDSAALAFAALTHLLFWMVVQPVNRHWTKGIEMTGAATRFFHTGAAAQAEDWTRLRDRWEWGHIARSVTATVAFLLTLIALAAI
jgi:hypothetical protein